MSEEEYFSAEDARDKVKVMMRRPFGYYSFDRQEAIEEMKSLPTELKQDIAKLPYRYLSDIGKSIADIVREERFKVSTAVGDALVKEMKRKKKGKNPARSSKVLLGPKHSHGELPDSPRRPYHPSFQYGSPCYHAARAPTDIRRCTE